MTSKIFTYLIAFFLLTSCASKLSQTKVLSDLKELSDDKYEGRKTGTKGAEIASKMIIHRFKVLGLRSFSDDYKQEFSITNRGKDTLKGKNIIGYIKGKNNQTMVISAHYDHLGVINGKVFNGADDDASGVCALLSYAEYFSKHQPKHTLIFVAFDAEEMGLLGSKYFVEHPPVAIKDIEININMDMIAHNDKNELYACGTFPFPELKKYIFTKTNQPKIIIGHDDPKLGHDDWTYQSDQGSFYAKKIPFIYFGVEDHPDYHKETDEFKNINQEFYVGAVHSILEIIKNIDSNYSIQKIMKDNQIMN